jgi:hypothetical protein
MEAILDLAKTMLYYVLVHFFISRQASRYVMNYQTLWKWAAAKNAVNAVNNRVVGLVGRRMRAAPQQVPLLPEVPDERVLQGRFLIICQIYQRNGTVKPQRYPFGPQNRRFLACYLLTSGY